MHAHRTYLVRALRIALLAVVSTALPLRGVAQDSALVRPTSATQADSAAKQPAQQQTSRDSTATQGYTPLKKFPRPASWALLVAALLGIAGGFIAEILATGGKITWGSKEPGGYDLGWLTWILLGVVGGVLVNFLKQGDGTWETLVITSFLGGLGAKTLLANALSGISLRTVRSVTRPALEALEQIKAAAQPSTPLEARIQAAESREGAAPSADGTVAKVNQIATKAQEEIGSRWGYWLLMR